MEQQQPYLLSVMLDDEEGFEETVCIQCGNQEESILFESLKIMQTPKPLPKIEEEVITSTQSEEAITAQPSEEAQKKLEETINIPPFLKDVPNDVTYSIPVGESSLLFEIQISDPSSSNPDMDSMTIDGGLLGKIVLSFASGQMEVVSETNKLEFLKGSNEIKIEFDSEEDMNRY